MNCRRRGEPRAPPSYDVTDCGAEALVPGSWGEPGEKRVEPGEKRQPKRRLTGALKLCQVRDSLLCTRWARSKGRQAEHRAIEPPGLLLLA